MILKSFEFNAFAENTYVLHFEKKAIIFDPGCYEKHEKDTLLSYLTENNLTPLAIINTHCHIDHVLGNYFLKNHFSIPLYIPSGEMDVLRSVEAYAPNWGITNFEKCEVDHLMPNEGLLKIEDFELDILYVPGHAPGHLAFYLPTKKWLLAGDVIFNQSIGRTDLPGGDYPTLEASIREKVYKLPDETEIFPGHGPKTTVGFEKQHNPFVPEV